MAENIESAADPQVTDIIRWTGTVIYWTVWPIGVSVYFVLFYVSLTISSIAKFIYRPLEFVLLPLVFLGQFILACLLAPFRFAARFETLYIYLGIAALVGLSLGFLVSLIFGLLRRPLGLDSQPNTNGRTAKQYREEARKRKAKAEAPLMSAGYLSPSYLSMSDGTRRGKVGKGLLSQTIMEEMDSEY